MELGFTSLRIVLSLGYSDTSVTVFLHLLSNLPIVCPIFSFLLSISFTVCCSLPSRTRRMCCLSTSSPLQIPPSTSSTRHFSPTTTDFCLGGQITEVALRWMLKRLRVGAILGSILMGYRMMDLLRVRRFSAGTFTTQPRLVSRCT